jgi:dephospho-CoA kinase
MKDMIKEYDPNYPIIVGLAGKAATGKTSVAQTIVPMASFNNTRGGIVWEHLFFAMPLYEFYSVRTKIEGINSQSRKLYGIHETLYDLYGSSPIGNIPTYDNFINLVHDIGAEKLDSDGSKPRSFLQNVGDLCREHDEKCFANWGIRKVTQMHKEYLKTIEENKEPSPYCVLISDVRFKNEAEAILARPNSMIIRFDTDDEVRRERIFKRDGFYMTDEQMNHRSEQEIDLFSDIVSAVVNSSSVSVEDQSSATMEAVKESFGLKNYAKN